MNKNEFLTCFNLKLLPLSSHTYKHNTSLKESAVLIGLIENPYTGLQVLLTKRSSHLKHHPSQISFPGGKVEPSDDNLIATALREAHEEIGLPPHAVSVIGQLSSYEVMSGYRITPIVAIINNKQAFQQDDNEVAEIFQVPLQHFISSESHHSLKVFKNNIHFNVHFFPYKHYNIWGATAAILKDLTEHIK